MNKTVRTIKNKMLPLLIYAVIVFGVGWVFYVIIASNLNSFLYGYELTIYNRDLDALFHSKALVNLEVKYVYKSGERGSIYYINIDTLTNIAVIKSTNYQSINLKEMYSEGVEEIDLSQNKTYTTFVHEPFPLIQQALNPRESMYLKISFEKPFLIEKEIINNRYCYFQGKFKVVVYGNKQNCSIVTFRGKHDNEILILSWKGKLYFIMQTASKISLLEIVDPALI